MEAICMSDDERFVRSVWIDVALYGELRIRQTGGWVEINGKRIGSMVFDKAAAWSAARQWTEARIKEVEDVREEIDAIKSDIAAFAHQSHPDVEEEPEAVIYRRILVKRLRAEQSRLVANMRPEYVAERGWALNG
jgi:hypothetical protein